MAKSEAQNDQLALSVLGVKFNRILHYTEGNEEAAVAFLKCYARDIEPLENVDWRDAVSIFETGYLERTNANV